SPKKGALCAVLGGRVAVVDVDTKNGGDPERVRNELLAGVRIFGEVQTPGTGAEGTPLAGVPGRHFYVACDPGLKSVNGKLDAYPGVDVLAAGHHVFLPGSYRPKYPGRGYVVLHNDLTALKDKGDPEGAALLARRVKEALEAKARERTMSNPVPTPSIPAQTHVPWQSDRASRYLDRALADEVVAVAGAPEGQRNDTLNRAAFNLGQLINAGLPRNVAEHELTQAARRAGLSEDETRSTIASGLDAGNDNPRAIPEPRYSSAANHAWEGAENGAPRGAVGHERPDENTDPEQWRALLHEREVAAEFRKLKVRQEAKARMRAEEEGEAPAFDSGTLAELLSRPPEPEYRVEGLIPWSGSTLLVAQRKTGKTTMVLNLAKALLGGEPFLGRQKTRPLAPDAKVGFLNYEVSPLTLARWADEAGVDPQRAFVVNLRGRRNPLTHPEDRQQLAALLRAQRVEALIVDPFGRAYGGTSENDSAEVGRWLTDLDRFARSEVGATDLVLTVHAGWNGDRTRGSSALEDWADTILTLTQDENGNRYLSARGRDVDMEKDQLAYDEDTRTLTLTGSGGPQQSRRRTRLEELLPHYLEVVRESPGQNTTVIHKALRDRKVASFQDRDISAVAKLAAERGLALVESQGLGKPTLHWPPTPSNPVQTPSRDGVEGVVSGSESAPRPTPSNPVQTPSRDGVAPYPVHPVQPRLYMDGVEGAGVQAPVEEVSNEKAWDGVPLPLARHAEADGTSAAPLLEGVRRGGPDELPPDIRVCVALGCNRTLTTSQDWETLCDATDEAHQQALDAINDSLPF
ncbi:MAG TPA: AAA family ATPase, partial [Spirochaetales bacterium]|nr:AAA family ATPase [Spirochaetales bacterium]